MSLVEAFRFPFYRIFFSVVVGIIALEGFVLSYNQKQKENNKKLQVIDGVLIRVIKSDSTKDLPLPGQIEIPFTIESFRGNNNQSAEFNINFPGSFDSEKTNNSSFSKSVIPKIKFTGGFAIESDPILVLENKPDIVIGSHWLFLKFKNWNIAAFVIYLILTTLIGEILCTIGELTVGILFLNFNPFNCKNEIEKCSIRSDSNIGLHHLLGAEEKQLEFSELHYILSRLYSGLAISLIVVLLENILLQYPALIGLCIVVFCLILLLSCLIGFIWIIIEEIKFTVFSVLAISTILLIPYYLPFSLMLALLVWFMFLMFLSITFRIQANRILIHKSAESDKETKTHKIEETQSGVQS